MKEKLEAIRKYNLWNGETLSIGLPLGGVFVEFYSICW